MNDISTILNYRLKRSKNSDAVLTIIWSNLIYSLSKIIKESEKI